MPGLNQHRQTRALAIVAVLMTSILFATLAAAPSATAEGGVGAAGAGALRGASVGTFRVAPVGSGEGMAQGAVVSGVVDATSSSGRLIRDLAVADASVAGSAATRVFSSIEVADFHPTSELSGVGTSSLTLTGQGLAVRLTDNVNSLLVVSATGATDQVVTFTTADAITISRSARFTNVWDVVGEGDAMRGALILVASGGSQANSGGSSIALSGAQRATATLKEGTELVFRADTSYATDLAAGADAALASYNEAVVRAIAEGRLAGEATTDLSRGASIIANANYFLSTQARTDASAAHRVTTTLKAQARTTASVAGDACATAGASAGAAASACAHADLLAYDLAYVDVPAQTAENVAVYVNGALAQKLDAAAHVAANANSYWATTVDGRVLVLANAALAARSAAQVTIAAVANARAAASTLAELDAQGELASELEGGFEMLGTLQSSATGSGQVIGTFSSFFANEARGGAAVTDVTDIRTSTEIFTKIEFAADVAADAAAEFTGTARGEVAGRAMSSTRAAGGAVVKMVTKVDGSTRVVAEFSDSVYATIRANAEAATETQFHLGNDIEARLLSQSEGIVELDGPAGRVGHLILAKAEGGVASRSRFDLSSHNTVKAHLEAGESIVFRSASHAQTKASAELAARAIAQGVLASETSVGYAANAITSANVDYRSHVRTAIRAGADATHRGLVTMDVTADSAARGGATVVSLVADRASLAAREAADIRVKVDGALALAAESAASLVAGASADAKARYFATTNLNGKPQILVSLPSLDAGSSSTIVFESVLEAQSRLNAALDVFGSFKAGYGGSAQGDIVSLVARQDAGLILDYTVAARSRADAAEGTVTTVFDSVRIGATAFAAVSAASSTALQYENEEATVEAFDVSAAVLKLTAKTETLAEFDLAENLEVTQVSPAVLMIDGPDFSGALILVQSAAASVSGSAQAQALATLEASAGSSEKVVARLTAGSEVIFKAFSGFESQLSDAERRVQAAAIASGSLVGQVTVRTVAGVTTATAVNYYPAVASSTVIGSTVGASGSSDTNVIGYGAVQAITQVASSDKVELVVSSANAAGKSIVLSLDRNTVKGLVHGDAKLLVDGKPIDAAASYSDALVADADKYYLMTAGGEVGLQALVTLGHFSTRTITLQSPPPPSMFLWTTIALAAVVVGQATYPVIRRRLK